MLKRLTLCLMSLILMATALSPMAALAEGDVPELTITLAKDVLVEDYYDNVYTKWIEEQNNVRLKFLELPASDAANKLAVMVASDEYLGDVICMTLAAEVVLSYANAGAILPLDEYYDKYDTNIEKYDEELGFTVLKAITSVDGHVYSVPQYTHQNSDELKWRIWMNQAWLKAVGKESPTTPDELYDVLVAFKTQDPNGNGQADEIPMLGTINGWSTDPTIFIMNAYTYDDAGNGYQVDAQGNVSFCWTKDAYREGLKYINRLVSEGLLGADSFSLTYAQYQELLNRETTIVGTFCFTAPHAMDVTLPANADYDYVSPLTGPEGFRYVSYAPSNPSQCWFITKDCKDPDLAFRVGDFLYTEEAYILNRFGIEGENWRYANAEELAKMESDEWLLLDYNSKWTESQKINWHLAGPALMERGNIVCMWNGDPNFHNYKRWIGVLEYISLMPQAGEFVPTLTFTTEETEELSEIKTVIDTYRRECKTRFILGDLSLESDWDSYLSELNAMGLERYTQICQAAYDRFLGQ